MGKGPGDQTVRHGQERLALVEVVSHSLPLKLGEKFLGDLATGSEFRKILSRERRNVESSGRPPFGSDRTHDIDGEDLDRALTKRDASPESKAIDQAVDAFSGRFATVLEQFLHTSEWTGTRRIVCGGGLMEGAVGDELVRRTAQRLQTRQGSIELRVLHHSPDDAGMIGWTFAAPAPVLRIGSGFLAVDIGGTNVRCGLVQVEGDRMRAGSYSVPWSSKWCHADDGTAGREEVVSRIVGGLEEACDTAAQLGIELAPFVGLSCPGVVGPYGRILRGAQNLPGNWTDPNFRLPEVVTARLAEGGREPPLVLLHNDAVIQALSELPLMLDADRWAAVTVGTGLGNCSFANRRHVE